MENTEKYLNEKDQVIFNLEIQGMQAAIKRAIMGHAQGLNELVDQRVKEALSEDMIKKAIDQKIKDVFEHDMKYGTGARMVQHIVEQKVRATVKALFPEPEVNNYET